MPKIIKLRKGLDIKLAGHADRRIETLPLAETYGIVPSVFEGFTPKLLVKQGDRVKAGSPVFFDKKRPEIVLSSPVSGTVQDVVRGEKRKILYVEIAADPGQEYEPFGAKDPAHMERGEVADAILKSGLWPFIVQRPYGIVANPADTPRAIFVSGFDSAPLAPDMELALEGEAENLRTGFEALGKLSGGKVHLGLRAGQKGVIASVANVEKHLFSGPHPAGNVGVQIANVAPVNKGEVVWTVNVQDVAIIGRLFNTGRVDMCRMIAVTGSEAADPCYVSAIGGVPYVSLLRGRLRAHTDSRPRIVDGNPLSGGTADPRGYVSLNTNQITLLPEGDKYEFLGWAMPRLGKFSVSRSYMSWLQPGKVYTLDTNLNGGHRPFIQTGLFERYLPMDIYPMYLLKAILAGDIDKMENLGIYEVVEEDFALCEFVDPSKNDIQSLIRDGINLMIKELD